MECVLLNVSNCCFVYGVLRFWFKYPGEVALPGGKAEEGDKDDGDTATREASEEIGLSPSLVNVIITLEPFLSKVMNKTPVGCFLQSLYGWPYSYVNSKDVCLGLSVFLKPNRHSLKHTSTMGIKIEYIFLVLSKIIVHNLYHG